MLAFKLSVVDLVLAVAVIILLILYLKETEAKPPTEEKQTFTIAHEIGHQKLENKRYILSNLTEKEIQKQEDEADELLKKWLS